MSQTVVALPRLVELRSQYYQKILHLVKEEGGMKGFVRFSGEHVESADAKFEVHRSETGNGLVHIRSCYNNKYLVLQKDSNWIVAQAEKPEEDQSKRSCTLLRPTSVDGNPEKIRLTNVFIDRYLSPWPTEDVPNKHYYACLYALPPHSYPDSSNVFHVMDWQSLVLLPRYVAFKGDNDKFLRGLRFEEENYLQFSVNSMEDDPMSVGNEIVQASNGKICIRNLQWDKYWRLSPNWIWADSTANFSNDETLFEAVKYDNHTIALKNVANNLFCSRVTTGGKESCLNAGSTTINHWSKFKVSELIISREIEYIKFRLMDARIYGESIVEMVSSSFTNHGNTTHEHTFTLTYTDKKSSTWTRTFSLKTGFEVTYDVGLPLIFEGKLKMGAEVSGAFMWGDTKEVEEKISSAYKVEIPPETKVTLRIMASRATCDVPFSYAQRDVLYTGKPVNTEMDDGVYIGVNNFNFNAESKRESLIQDPNRAAAEFKKVAIVSPEGVITPM